MSRIRRWWQWLASSLHRCQHARVWVVPAHKLKWTVLKSSSGNEDEFPPQRLRYFCHNHRRQPVGGIRGKVLERFTKLRRLHPLGIVNMCENNPSKCDALISHHPESTACGPADGCCDPAILCHYTQTDGPTENATYCVFLFLFDV